VSEPLLQVQKLSKNFDRLPVLKDVTFSLKRGEVLGLVGRQGAGKSTLLHLISGTMSPSAGTIYFDGKPCRFANRMQAQKLGIETVYQTTGPMNRFDAVNNPQWDRGFGAATAGHTSGLLEGADATYNILLGREITKDSILRIIDWKKMIDIARGLLGEFDLPPELAQEQVRNLSDEQRQVLMLARAFYRPCRLLLLDDIIPALSFQRQEILLEKIKKLAVGGTSIIIISDDLKHLFAVTDRILVLYEGRLVADRRTSESVPREIVELIVGSSQREYVSPLIWALESYHTAQQQTEELRRTQTSLQESLEASDSLNRQLVERLRNQLGALDQLNAALQATQRRLITEREDERKALERELHDQLIKDLLGLNYRLEEVEGSEISSFLQQEVSSVREGIRNVVSELRQVCSNRPPTIDHHYGRSLACAGVVGALRYSTATGDRPGPGPSAGNDRIVGFPHRAGGVA
jgi:ABC-type branched-subunit amino acid transport system ATPase component